MSAEQPVKSWPIRGYWIGFNPKTHKGLVALQMDNNADDPELTFKDLPGDDVAALAAILTQSGVEYRSTGLIGIKNT